MTNSEYIRQGIENRIGIRSCTNLVPDLDILKTSQWDSRFELLMRNRLVMGAFRYGLFGSPSKKGYDQIESIIRRANLYLKDGNTEHLVDIANLALVEFVVGEHPNKHFHAQDDRHHTEKINESNG